MLNGKNLVKLEKKLTQARTRCCCICTRYQRILQERSALMRKGTGIGTDITARSIQRMLQPRGMPDSKIKLLKKNLQLENHC